MYNNNNHAMTNMMIFHNVTLCIIIITLFNLLKKLIQVT